MVGSAKRGDQCAPRYPARRRRIRTRRNQMQLRSALLAATVLALPVAASAQPVTGLYMGMGVGVNITQKEDVRSFSLPAISPATGIGVGSADGSTGFAGLVSVGWGFGNGLRAELEGNYRSNNGSGFTGTRIGTSGVGGGSDRQIFG